MRRILGLAILSFQFLSFAPAQAAPLCRITIDQPRLHLEECGEGSKELSLRIGEKMPFALRAVFSAGVGERLFDRLAPLEKSRALRRSDQALLRAALASPSAAGRSAEARSLLKFLSSFAKAGFEPHAVDLRSLPSRRRPQGFAQMHILCERLGRPATGYFTARGQAWRQTMVVGSHDCTGKCGQGCAPDGRWDQGTYTQECFNHDLCVDMTGENMGDCEDEFWAAADGFLNGPHCMFVDLRKKQN